MTHILTKLTVLPQSDCAEATALARELGLELQARRYEKPLAERTFTPLTDDETTLWAFHCPTRYVPGGGQNVRKLEDYAFDSIPIEVMRHWKAIKDAYTFDRFEVWTTERTPAQNDPLLMGVIGPRFYLLARWGLESPEQLPLKEIARRVYEWGLEEARSWGASYPFQSEEKIIAANLPRVERYYGRVGAARRVLGMA